jgi:hypothetical protein
VADIPVKVVEVPLNDARLLTQEQESAGTDDSGFKRQTIYVVAGVGAFLPSQIDLREAKRQGYEVEKTSIDLSEFWAEQESANE